MTYILEDLTDEDRKKYNVRVPWGRDEIKKWVIDRERESFLIYQMSDVDSGIRVFLLSWKGKIVEFYVHQKLSEIKENNKVVKLDSRYIVDKIFATYSFEKDIPQIKEAIEEALIAYGWNEGQEFRGKTTVDKMDDTEIIFKDINEQNLFVGE